MPFSFRCLQMRDAGKDKMVSNKRTPSLFRQIAVRLAIVTLIFALVDVGLVVFTYSRQPQSLAQELLSLEADKAASQTIGNNPGLEGPPGADRWFASYVDPTLSNPNGATTIHPSPNGGTMIDWTKREKLQNGFRISGLREVNVDGEQRWLYMQFEGSGLKSYVPVIANELIQHVALPLIPLSLMMLLFNIFAVRRVLNPLRKAEEEVDGLDPENMSVRINEPAAPREVTTLVRAVNRALERLDDAMTILRSFTANVAHELRTPLSIMQLSIDQLPKSEQREALLEDNRQMTRLVNQMLDLAQADAKAFETDAVVDLAKVGRQAVSQLAPKAFQAGRDLVFEDCGGAIINGHEEAIYRIYRNLIDNALAHASGNSPIEIAAGPGPRFHVRDHGPGVSEQDAANLFERFWRKDRSSGTGAGLGLGIVRKLAEAHGGTVTIENPRSGGARFVVVFPDPANLRRSK